MDFCEPGSPQDDIFHVAAVLDFLTDILSWPPYGEGVSLEGKSLTGLYLILSTCQKTLEKSAKE